MPARLLPLIALAFALAAPALAAPSPFRRAEPPQPDVSLTHTLRNFRRPDLDTVVIARQNDWQTCAEAWGIADPLRVDFRTHFLAAHVSWSHRGPVQFVLSGGDLRVGVAPGSDDW